MANIDDDWKQYLFAHYNATNPEFNVVSDTTEPAFESVRSDADEAYASMMRNKTDDEIEANIQPLYISTCTKIFYLNVSDIEYSQLFWSLPVINYGDPAPGIIKKQIMIKSKTPADVDEYLSKKDEIRQFYTEKITKQINNTNANARKNRFKDERILTVGLAKKDIMNCHSKEKMAFINCFAITDRIKNRHTKRFLEFHMKIFKTGKITIPGITDNDDDVIADLRESIVEHLRPYIKMPTPDHVLALLPENQLPKKKCIIKDKKGSKMATMTTASAGNGVVGKNCRVVYTDTKSDILINSNFNCGFHINQNRFCEILCNKYGLIQTTYNKVNYPGIKCRYFVDNNKPLDHAVQNGIVDPVDYEMDPVKFSEKYTQVTFIPFRTGRSLILGSFPKHILLFVYEFVRRILIAEYKQICNVNGRDIDREKKTKPRRRTLLITDNYNTLLLNMLDK